jgi:enoyl-CoA hydratase/carnithine racemase
LLTKSLLKKPHHDIFSAHMRFEGQHFMERVTSPEALEAFSAFQEKRQPNFRQFDPV